MQSQALIDRHVCAMRPSSTVLNVSVELVWLPAKSCVCVSAGTQTIVFVCVYRGREQLFLCSKGSRGPGLACACLLDCAQAIMSLGVSEPSAGSDVRARASAHPPHAPHPLRPLLSTRAAVPARVSPCRTRFLPAQCHG